MLACNLALLLFATALPPEEVELFAKSLRPEGRAELEANLAPLSQLPVSEVEAEFDPRGARVEGQLRLVVHNREAQPWFEVVLRAYPNAGHGTSLRVDDVRVEGKRVAAKTHGTVIAIPAEVAPGATVALSMGFKGQMLRIEDDGDALTGFTRQTDQGYGTFAVSPSGASLIDWYPQLAARAHGVWDREEPGALGDMSHADPGNALVALTVPKGWKVAGAGTALGQHPVSAAKETAAFAMAGIRGALGLAASPSFTEIIEVADGIELRAASLHEEEGAKALTRCAKAALASLQKRFGAYPWRSLSLAEISLTAGAGGVELPGLALVAQSLSPRTQSGFSPRGLFDFTCYHEVAHQWWQAVVGSDPRETPWVDEALAQYSAVLIEEDAKGNPASAQALATWVALNYQGMRMAQVPDGKVARPSAEFRSPLAYAGLVYGKAPLFYQHAQDLMGAEKFDAATRAYRKAWAFREAGAGAWLEAARRTDPKHADALSALHHRWFEEKHGDDDVGALDAVSLMDALGGGGNNFSLLLKALQAPGSEAQIREALKQLERLMPEPSGALDEP